MAQDFGTVQHGDKTLTLTQQAYADRDHGLVEAGSIIYRAIATDAEGNEYRVIWAQYDGFDGDDESDACDWSNPARVDAL